MQALSQYLLDLFPNALPVAFKAFVIAPTTAPIVTPAAITIAVTVTPYFFEYLLYPLTKWKRSFSFIKSAFANEQAPLVFLQRGLRQLLYQKVMASALSIIA